MNKLPLFISLINTEHRKQFILLLIGSIFNGLLQVTSIASIMPFLSVAANPTVIHTNQYLRYIYSVLDFSNDRSFLLFLGGSLILLIFFINISNAIIYWFNTRFTWAFNHALSCRLINHYMSLDYVSFVQRNSSELQKNIQTETNDITSNILTPILNILNGGMTLLLIMILVIVVQPIVALIIGGVFFIVYLIIYLSVRKVLEKIGRDSLEDNKIKFQTINEALGSFKIAKLMHKENYFSARYAIASKSFTRNQARRITTSQIPKFAVEAIAFSTMIGFSLLLISLYSDFSEVIPVLGLYAFAAYRFIPGAQLLYSSLATIRSRWSHVVYLCNELEHEPKGKSIQERSNKKRSIGQIAHHSIVLNNVSFSYPGSKGKTIDKVSLKIDPNTTVGFFGTTGSGKTTIIDIVLGLLAPDKGEIYLNDALFNSEDMVNWQKSIGYVPQDIYLIDGTIMENIAIGIPYSDIDLNQVKRVCSLANISSFIENNLASKYKTTIGERGVRLSGGQRQRLGIARALYHNPTLIVFDEATSALDDETEKYVMDSLSNLAHQNTIIIVAHRTSTLRVCDNIYRIEGGKIVASGAFSDIFL
jgi:ATP-binding cassette, subfamily B, bacterial PglK